MPRLAVAVGAVAVMAIGGVAFVASSGAQAPGPQTLVLKETEGKGRYIDEKPLSKLCGGNPSIGDSFAFSNFLSDSAGKRVGKLQAVCTIVDPVSEELDGPAVQWRRQAERRGSAARGSVH